MKAPAGVAGRIAKLGPARCGVEHDVAPILRTVTPLDVELGEDEATSLGIQKGRKARLQKAVA